MSTAIISCNDNAGQMVIRLKKRYNQCQLIKIKKPTRKIRVGFLLL
jgi:hypothetical protein